MSRRDGSLPEGVRNYTRMVEGSSMFEGVRRDLMLLVELDQRRWRDRELDVETLADALAALVEQPPAGEGRRVDRLVVRCRKRNGDGVLHRLPAQYVRRMLRREDLVLSGPAGEVASALLDDGYDESFGELLELSHLAVKP